MKERLSIAMLPCNISVSFFLYCGIVCSIMSVLFLIVLSSCSVSSDPETEKKLVGKWETTGIVEMEGVEFNYINKLTLSADNTFRVELNFEYSQDDPDLGFTIKYEGEWKASSDKFFLKIDEKSFNFIFSEAVDKKDAEDFEKEVTAVIKKEGLESTDEIITLSHDSFSIYNEESKERTKYNRVMRSSNKGETTRRRENKDVNKDNSSIASGAEQSRKLQLRVRSGNSSNLGQQGNNTYVPANLIDGNIATAWAIDLNKQNNSEIYGPEFDIIDGKKIDYIILYNGYAKNQTSYKNNTRPAWIKIYRTSDAYPEYIDESDILYEGPLSDTSSPQRLNINPRFDTSSPVDRFEIDFPSKNERNRFFFGEKWPKDMVISEIEIWGN